MKCVIQTDSDFMPVSAAGGGKGDLYCEFNDFTILTEVTMSTSSRQEAMEGVNLSDRHVSDAVLRYDKPVYGMFIAVRIDTNTAETFRHGIWYAKGDVKQRLDIVPLTLAQFQKYFVSMFEADKANPREAQRFDCKMRISEGYFGRLQLGSGILTPLLPKKSLEITNGIVAHSDPKHLLFPAGARYHMAFEKAKSLRLRLIFLSVLPKQMNCLIWRSLPDEVSFCP